MNPYKVLFTIPRCAGWIAHWVEALESDMKIFRPRQVFLGPKARPYLPIEERPKRADADDEKENPLRAAQSTLYMRRNISTGGFALPKTAGKQNN